MSFTVIKNKKRRRKGLHALQNSSQRKGVCRRVFITTPKKPHSAKRKVAKVFFTSRVHRHCYIAGIGHNVQKYSNVLIRGGRTRDLPGIYYQIIRGKFDSKPVNNRNNARSKYGIKKKFSLKQTPRKKKERRKSK
jgi:small subunit ribosomal protein S12